MSPRDGSVEVHIEELILDGVPGCDRAAIARDVATALAAQLARDGVPAAARQPAIRDRVVVAAPPARPGRLAADVAAAVYRGLGTR